MAEDSINREGQLSEKEQEQIDSDLSAHESIELTIETAKDAQKDAKEKRWGCYDKIGRILKGLEKYAKIVNIGI
ncbi:hypothetical protein K440DRAFT_613322 [Wilcoxina mikolae CBS 423.85]|nr:hypothetical protein K440DRAFT_613322 [Wilcoxina mikolae CBS 423.85]